MAGRSSGDSQGGIARARRAPGCACRPQDAVLAASEAPACPLWLRAFFSFFSVLAFSFIAFFFLRRVLTMRE
jgi:hypothetical protein